MAGGAAGADDTGGDTGEGGSGGSGDHGGSGGSTVKADAGAPSGGSGGGDQPVPDSGTTTTTIPDAGTSGEAGVPEVPTSGLHKVFDGMTADGWSMYPPGNCVVKDGTLAASGIGRGWCATREDLSHFRVLFSLHPGGTGGHAPTVLVFNTRAPEGEKGLDALGGIQFQPPNGGHWDYRPGKNNAGAGFSKIGGPGPAMNGWYICEIVGNAATGEAKMACGGKDVLHYKDPTAGKKGPFAIQTHNKGITDAYKDIQVEDGLTDDKYLTVK
jgi:hypothetical protein